MGPPLPGAGRSPRRRVRGAGAGGEAERRGRAGERDLRDRQLLPGVRRGPGRVAHPRARRRAGPQGDGRSRRGPAPPRRAAGRRADLRRQAAGARASPGRRRRSRPQRDPARGDGAMIALLLAALYTNTESVARAVVDGGAIWAATAGGVEQYDLRTGARLRLLTTDDGL